jgi:hypothetical protein
MLQDNALHDVIDNHSEKLVDHINLIPASTAAAHCLVFQKLYGSACGA